MWNGGGREEKFEKKKKNSDLFHFQSSLTTHRPPNSDVNTVNAAKHVTALRLRRTMKTTGTVSSMFSGDVVKTTEPCLSCPGC